MKTTANPNDSRFEHSLATRAATRLGFVVILAVGFLLAGGGYWYWRQSPPPPLPPVEVPVSGVVLSETTTRILAGLAAPIELRLFAPADGSLLPADLGGYLNRVGTLLAEYARVAAGPLRVIKADPLTDPAAKTAAGAAGVVPFTTGNGDVIYLGLAISSGSRVETVAPLAPEWEAALESDVSRAIARVTAKIALAAPFVTGTPGQPAPIDPKLSEKLLRQFPDMGNRSFAEMAQTLRSAALEEFKSDATAMLTKVSDAQKTLAEAQANKSEADQQSALQALQAAQAEQADKLKGITARLQEQIAVLERLKRAPNAPAAVRQP